MTEMETPMLKVQKTGTRAAIEATALIIGATLLAGMLAGYLDASGITGLLRTLAPPAIILVAAIAAGLIIRRSLPNMNPRQSRYATSFLIAIVIGAIVGGWAQFAGLSVKSFDLSGQGSLSASTAFGLASIWTFGMAISMYFYHHGIDDHEERAWLWAGLAGWYAFIFPTPVWLVLARADILPPVNVLMLMIFSMIVNAIVWLWLKFR